MRRLAIIGLVAILAGETFNLAVDDPAILKGATGLKAAHEAAERSTRPAISCILVLQ